MPSRVFVTRQIPEAGLKPIRQSTECMVWPNQLPPTPEALIENGHGCDGILTLLSDRVDAAVLDAVGPQLKVISNFAVGYNNIDIAECSRRGIAVGNTPDVLTDATADIAVALLLAASRRVREGIETVSNSEWLTWEPLGFIGQDLSNKTLGIVGMGRIGFATARRLRSGWNMNVLYTSRTGKPKADAELDAQQVSMEELLKRSDFVSIHTDLNPATENLLDAAAFAAMKSSAVLVNTSRGGVVDEVALHSALTGGQIFAAGLDVTNPEPLAAESPLRQLSNCVVVPHIGSATVSSRDAMAEIAADNLIAGLNGKPLRHQVN